MAGAASSSSSASPLKAQYDVFVSFRGEDTRKNFTSHLYAALSRKKIQTYKDDRNIEKGEEVWPALAHAIDNSYLCILVFSENYASSTWCLRELTRILEGKKEKQVIPVFYQIKPTDVRKQTGSFEKAFRDHEENPQLGDEVVRKWRASLEKASNLSGFDSESNKIRDDDDLIENIVKDICQKLEHIYPKSDPKGLVGIHENYTHIKSLLENFQYIGLWGMGGIGKTTIARVLFNRCSSQFEGHCFLDNVRENSGKLGHEIRGLRERLFSELLNEPVKPESEVVKKRVSCMTVFIVLDDVNNPQQIEDLLSDICLVSDSRIVITARDKEVFNRSDYKIHEVKGLADKKSFELFYLNAFDKGHHPQKEFQCLSERAVRYASGLPLALKLLGSFLRTKTKGQWECALEKLKSRPYSPIDNVLRLSYDELEVEEQDIFLDIAFFFKGETKYVVKNYLKACNFHATSGLYTLENKALITISICGTVEMHDLIQEMGWEIVRKQCIKDPGKRSRLKDPKDIFDVLENSKESDLTEGIILDMTKSEDLRLNTDSFTKMSNLRFLKFYGSRYRSSCKVYIPSHTRLIFNKLRYFQWNAWPLQSLPSTFCSEKLVELHMPNSHLEKLWHGVQDTMNLRIINLSGSKRLIEFPNLSNSSNLESINLNACENLRSVDLSNLCLPKLNYLNLSFCKKLESLLSETPLESLTMLDVQWCSSLKEFSLSSKEIQVLDLNMTAIEILPPSIGKCSKLKYLYLPVSLKNLPNELSNLRFLQLLRLGNRRELDTGNLDIILDGLQSLEELDLSGCLKLESFLSKAPLKYLNVKGCSSIKEFSLSSKEIQVLNLRETIIEILPPSIGKCSKLESLYLPVSLKNLPDELSKLRSLQRVSLCNCRELDTRNLNIILDGLQSLEELDLSGCLKLESFLSKAPLKYLNVKGCSSLKEFSLSSEEIMELNLRETIIEILPPSIGKCSKLECLYLPVSLKNLPDELSKLRSLQELVLGNCKELDTGNLHFILDGLQSLKKLDLSGCCNLSHFPHNLGIISRLGMLTLDGINVESLPTSITHLSQLRTLSLQYCKKLQYLPKLPPSIQLLKANKCISLETVLFFMELKVASCQMDFQHCVKLDQGSLFRVQACLDFMIKQREASEFHFYVPTCFEACFPGNKIPRCFLHRATQRWINIEIPACLDLMGFTFCVIIFPNIMPLDSEGFIISCECHFGNGENAKFQYIRKPDPNEVYSDPGIVGMVSEHVYVWCEDYYFMGRLNNIEEKANNQCTNFNQNVSIDFSFYVTNGAKTMEMNQMIKQCGVRPILNKKEQSLDLNMDIKTKGCWDIHNQCRKKFKAFELELELGTKSYSYQHIDEFESSLTKIGVDGTGFDHISLQTLDQRKELKEFIFQPLSANCCKQKSRDDFTELNLTCLMQNWFNELDKTIQEARVCPTDVSEFQNSIGQMELDLDLDLELALGVK